ncbi:hypothetical protein F8568_002785 [Actinomadura sp. LD22]|uniref:Uncharacterized protein n=1 Tax=Actinomadura physcomitrii TaxID=2650748 RepID=A0A6I4M6D1_9ACTN|nr:hypothetical protein [Actinomadura physcomitrii]MVZ99330.1 hypothetical protein [Actinomadura physcomitrii]
MKLDPNTAARIRGLLAPLISDAGHFLRVHVGDDPALTPAELLHLVLFDPSFDRGPFVEVGPPPPSALDEITRALRPVPATAEQMPPSWCTSPPRKMAYGSPAGPWTPQTALPPLERLIFLLQPDARWWTNVEYAAWNWEHGEFHDTFGSSPVTGHMLDCALVGIGHDATVTFLAYSDS